MLVLLLAVITTILDQCSKAYIQSTMEPGMSIPVINGIFHITYILNPGAAFGIMQHKTSFFIAVAFGLFAVALYFYPRIPKEYTLLRVGLGLQVGGALGNVVDRIKTGHVVDFFDFRIWPVFNIADIAIVSGVFLIIYSLLFLSGKEDGQSDRRGL